MYGNEFGVANLSRSSSGRQDNSLAIVMMTTDAVVEESITIVHERWEPSSQQPTSTSLTGQDATIQLTPCQATLPAMGLHRPGQALLGWHGIAARKSRPP